MKYKIIGIIIIIFFWYLIFFIKESIFFPDPFSVFKKIIFLLQTKELYYNLFFSLYRVIAGIILSIFIGIPLGLILGYNKKIYKISELAIDFFRSVPATALFPLTLLIFGIGDLAKIAIVTFSCTLILTLQTYYGVINVSTVRKDILKVLNSSKVARFKHLLIWEALPHIFSGLRITVSLALILVIVTEMFIGTNYGLGKKLIDAQSTYKILELYSMIIIIGTLGFILNKIILIFERKLIHWRR